MPETPPTSAARRRPEPWTVLDGGDFSDGTAMVVPDDLTDVTDGLFALVSNVYGGAQAEWSKDNLVLLAAVKDCRLLTYHSCTKAWCDNEGIDPDGFTSGWWAPHGDGARSIRVLWYTGDAYDLGEQAEEAETQDMPDPVTTSAAGSSQRIIDPRGFAGQPYDQQPRTPGVPGSTGPMLEGWAITEAAKHQPDARRGGCTCGFCAWSVEHVVVMSVREAVRRVGIDR